MSIVASTPAAAVRALPWQLWIAQTAAILRIEIKKTLWMRRGIWIYLIALAPVGLIAIHAIDSPLGRHCNLPQDTEILAGIFQVFYLRFAIFFGCLGLFTWLFRGEIVEKTLHYYFLSPVRREVLVAGKFLAGIISSVLIFGLSIFLSFALMYGHFGPAGRAYVFSGPGAGQLVAYLSVTVLACLGYGSIFLALSLVFKNPILPGIVVLLWEMFHAVLPPLLQKLSVAFYLKQLCPVSVPPVGILALFTVVAEPVSAYLAVSGLLCLCATILLFAFWRVHTFEISYLAD
jgi:ABC-type transport system involved in multi-copper enzyme maturation permease subunit